jgi:hypothetical protein
LIEKRQQAIHFSIDAADTQGSRIVDEPHRSNYSCIYYSTTDAVVLFFLLFSLALFSFFVSYSICLCSKISMCLSFRNMTFPYILSWNR